MREPSVDPGYIFYPATAPFLTFDLLFTDNLPYLEVEGFVNVSGVQISAISHPPSDLQYCPTALPYGPARVTQQCGVSRTWALARISFICQGSTRAAWIATTLLSRRILVFPRKEEITEMVRDAPLEKIVLEVVQK